MEVHSQLKKNNFLQQIDIFGIGINIRFNKKQKYNTRIGGVMTIILATLLIYQIQLISTNFLDTTNPIVLFEQRFTPEPERYNLTSDKFMMTFGMQNNKSQHYIDPSVYTPELWIKQTVKAYDSNTGAYSANPQRRQVSIEPCTIDHFTIPAVNGYFEALNYKNMYCINKNETELYLEGEFDALHYSTLELTISACSGSQCNPNMNQILNLGRLAVYYVDYSVVSSNKENPFQPLGRQSFWVSGPQFTKITTINFRNSYLKSDYGLIGESLVEDRILTFSNDREQTAPQSGLLFDCYISFEKNIDSIYKRSYRKLDQSLSQLGGIYNLFFIIGTLICKPLSQLELNVKLINSMFTVDDKQGKIQSETKQAQIEQSQIKKDNSLHETHQNFISDIQKSQQLKYKMNEIQKEMHDILSVSNNNNNNTTTMKYEIEQYIRSLEENSNQLPSSPTKKNCTQSKILGLQQNLEIQSQIKDIQKKSEIDKQTNELKQFFSVVNSTISFKCWEYFLNYFSFSRFCHKRKYALVKKGVEKLYYQIDVFSLLQKMQEIEKLKRLLLSADQIKLFEYIPKPKLEIEDSQLSGEKKAEVLNSAKKDILAKAKDAQSAFLSIANSNKKPSKIDVKLLEQLDPKFKQYLIQKCEGEPLRRCDLSMQGAWKYHRSDIQPFSILDPYIDNEEINAQIAAESIPTQYQPNDSIAQLIKTQSFITKKKE